MSKQQKNWEIKKQLKPKADEEKWRVSKTISLEVVVLVIREAEDQLN